MKSISLSPTYMLLITAISCSLITNAQHTFSICAVDTSTGQVGSAGATCITSSTVSAIIISDVHPGVGVVHTQASWLAANQNYARSLMNMGLTPRQIIDSVKLHDSQNNSTVRQYGIVSLDSGGLSAAFTGVNCLNYHNNITGPNYSIQGNILLGPQVLDSMEARFLNTPGTLACKLMAALQGAKVAGADTRCMSYGISSFSSFLRVANTNDTPGNFFLDLTVNTFPDTIDPVDSLQALFDFAGGCNLTYVNVHDAKREIKLFPNPANEKIFIESDNDFNALKLINPQGIILKHWRLQPAKKYDVDLSHFEKGIYFFCIHFVNGKQSTIKFVKK